MLKDSVSGTDIIKSIQKEIWNLQIDDELKVRLTEKTGEIEFRLVEGSDEFIQLESLLASFVLAGKGIIKYQKQQLEETYFTQFDNFTVFTRVHGAGLDVFRHRFGDGV